jgi:transposase-like protein
MNVLNCLAKLFQPKAKVASHNVWQAENKVDAEKAFNLFIETYEPKYPKAALCLKKRLDRTQVILRFPSPTLAKHPHQQSN